MNGRIAGVCLRWGADPERVEEAVVVVPSGHPALDRGIPESIRRMRWAAPTGDYDGGWIGIWLAFGSDVSPEDMPRGFPDCSMLPPPPGRAQTAT